MRAHMGAYVAREINQAKSSGPTGILDPSNVRGRRTKAHRAKQRALALPPFIPEKSSLFAPCGTKFLFLFAGDVAHRGASNLTREKEHRGASDHAR